MRSGTEARMISIFDVHVPCACVPSMWRVGLMCLVLSHHAGLKFNYGPFIDDELMDVKSQA